MFILVKLLFIKNDYCIGIMFVCLLFLYSTLSTLSLCQAHICPNPEDLKPCKCEIISNVGSTINCRGDDLDIKKVFGRLSQDSGVVHSLFHRLEINYSKIEEIPE